MKEIKYFSYSLFLNLTLFAECNTIINKAKKDQVPGHVIDNAINRVKNGATDNYEELQFEGFGPNGSTLIVKCLTDNVNRTISQVRPAFTKAHSKLGAEGSVSYLYNVQAVIQFKGLNEEETLDALIEGDVDAKDLETLEDGSIRITGEPTDYNAIKLAIQAKLPNVDFDVDEIQTVPTETVELEGEDMVLFERLMNLLNDCEDVDQVYHNVSNYNDGEEE